MSSKSTTRGQRRGRTTAGAALPLVVFSVLVVAAFLALTVNVMRNALAVRKLQFAAEAAATHALSLSTDAIGNYTPGGAESRALTALTASGGDAASAWNSAPIGPVDYKSGPYNAGVAFGNENVQVTRNPADDSEMWLRITARRQGADALRMSFLPMILAINLRDGEALPGNAYQVEPWRTTEVIGQPASRIGAGAPRTDATAGRAAELAGHAVFPLGITLREFQLLANPAEARTRYIVDMQASNSPTFSQPAANGHLKGYFVNVTATGGANYYGDGSGNLSVDQLMANLRYFRVAADNTETPPAAIERGGRLAWFDQADASVASRKAQIISALRQLPLPRHYLMPILRNDPQVGTRNEVVGFGRLRVAQAVNASGTDFEILVDVADSVPVRNASSATGMAAVPPFVGTLLPEPVVPFRMRRNIGASDAIEIRSRGIALAPAVSARQFRVSP